MHSSPTGLTPEICDVLGILFFYLTVSLSPPGFLEAAAKEVEFRARVSSFFGLAVAASSDNECWRKLFPDHDHSGYMSLRELIAAAAVYKSDKKKLKVWNQRYTLEWSEAGKLHVGSTTTAAKRPGTIAVSDLWTIQGRGVSKSGSEEEDLRRRISRYLPPLPAELVPLPFQTDHELTFLVGTTTIAALDASLAGTIHSDGVKQVVAGRLIQKRVEALDDSAQVPAKLVPLLLSQGVLCSSDDVGDHAHGAHKAIENHVYRKVYPGYATMPTTVCTQKVAKFERMRKANSNFLVLKNATLDSEDEKRYVDTERTDFTDICTPALFLCDSGHHVTRAEAAAIFRANPSLEKVYLAGIMPGETLSGHSSVHSALYRIVYDAEGEGFDYLMEGTAQGYYHHHQRPWMLKPGVVEVAFQDGNTIHFTVEPLVSIFAHTLVVLTRGVQVQKVKPSYRQQAPPLVAIPEVFLENLPRNSRRGHSLVPANLLRDLVNYMPTLKNKDSLESMAAKIRSNFNNPLYDGIPNDVWSELLLVSWEMSRQLNQPVFTGKLGLTALDIFVRSVAVRCLEFVKENRAQIAYAAWQALSSLVAPWMTLPSMAAFVARKYLLNEAWDLVDACSLASFVLGPVAALAGLSALLGVAAYEWRRARHQVRAKRVLEIMASTFSLQFDAQYCLVLPEPKAHILDFKDDEIHFSEKPLRWATSADCCGAPLELCLDCSNRRAADSRELVRLRDVAAENALHQASASRRRGAAVSGDEIAQALIHVGTQKLRGIPEADATSTEVQALLNESSQNGQAADSIITGDVKGKNVDPAERPKKAASRRSSISSIASIMREDLSAPIPIPPAAPSVDELPAPPADPSHLVTRTNPVPTAAVTNPRIEGVKNKYRASSDRAAEEAVRTIPADSSSSGLTPALPAPAEFFRDSRGEPASEGQSDEDDEKDLFGHTRLEKREHLEARLLEAELSRGFADLSVLLALDPRLHHGHRAEWMVILAGPIECVPYEVQDSCGVLAAAKHLKVKPDSLWKAMCAVIPGRQMLDWQKNGCDERWFAAVGYYFKATFVLTGSALAKKSEHEMLLVGVRGKEALHIAYSDDPAHWEAMDFKPTALLKPYLSDPRKKGPSKGGFKQFLDRLESFRSSHGAGVPGEWRPYTATMKRADMLASEYNEGVAGGIRALEGKRYVKDFTKKLKFTGDNIGSKEISVRLCSGFAGCGKSNPLQEFLAGEQQAGLDGHWVVGVPRLPLRQAWKDAVKPSVGYLLNTFEMLFIRGGTMVVTDEHGLLLPGFLDFLALNTNATHFLVLGDETQCQAHNPNPESSLEKLEPEMSYINRQVGGTFWLWSHRIPQWLSTFLGVVSSNPIQGAYRFTSVINRRDPIVVPDDFNKRKLGNASLKSFTFSGIQGQTHEHVQILCNRTSLTITGAQDFVQAMTRSENLVSFVFEDASLYRLAARHPVLSKLLSGQRWDYRSQMAHILRKYDVELPNVEEMDRIRSSRPLIASTTGQAPRSFATASHSAGAIDTLSRGKAHPLRPVDRVGPQAQVYYVGMDYEAGLEVANSLPTGRLENPGLRTHVPSMRPEAWTARYLEDYLERFERELHTERGSTRCFPDDVGFEEILAMFPRQHSSDEAFCMVTYAKRLSRRSHDENEKEFASRSSALTGLMLFNYALEAMKLPDEAPWDRDLFNQCILQQEHARVTGRSAAVLANNDARADPDTDMTFVQHWIKGQVKKKKECLNMRFAKAGQTLATCHESVIHMFGCHFRYCMEQIKRHAPANIWIHHGKDLKQFDDWAREHWTQDLRTGTLGTVNDFSNFDMTQGAESVHMECHWLRWSGAPDWVIEAYSHWKLHIRSSVVGPKQTSRDTGEPNTFGGNTLYSIGNTAMKYGPEALHTGAWCFGGDDMACDKAVYESHEWHSVWSKCIRTESKTFHLNEVDFCGYILTREGILRDPLIMLLKALYTQAVGDIKLSLSGYSMELSFTFAKGDLIYDLLSDGAIHALGVFLDIVHQHAPLTAASYFSSDVDIIAIAERAVARILSAKSLKGKKTELQGWQRLLTKGRSLPPLPRAVICVNVFKLASSGPFVDVSLALDKSMASSQQPTPPSSASTQGSIAQSILSALGMAPSGGAGNQSRNGVDPGAPEVTAALSNAMGVPVGVIGRSWNANVRPFEIAFPNLVAPEDKSKGQVGGCLVSWTPMACDLIKHFVEFNPTAFLRGLRIRFVAGPGLASCYVTVISAVAMSTQIPGDWESILRLPSAQRVILQPIAKNFFPPPLEREFIVESYGVQSQFKPEPIMGGSPALCFWMAFICSDDLKKDTYLGDLNISCVVERA